MRNFYFLSNLCKTIMNSLKREDGVIWEEATIDHPLSIYSAYIGTSRKAGGKLLRIAAMMCLLMTLGVGQIWADSGTLTSAELSSNITNTTCAYSTPKSAYTDQGVTYTACGYTDAANRPWLQLKKDAGAYMKIAVASTKKITSVDVTITSATNSKGGITDITMHTDYSDYVYLRTSASGTPATGAVASTNTISSDVASLTISSGSYYELYIQVASGARIWSITVNYEDAVSKCATPTFSVSTGTYNANQSVTISCATAGASIYYTTNGTTPTSSSTAYSSAVSITSTKTLKAIAIKAGMTNSDVASATYTLQCATPTFSPTAGTYTGSQSVSISCATGSSTIHYTTDGSTPTGSSPTYSSAITVDCSKTVKAIATKTGWSNSAVGTAAYTIKYSVTWKVNGSAWTPKTTTGKGTDGSADVVCGSRVSTLPTAPDPENDACGDKFVGWTDATDGAYVHGTSTLFTTAGTAPVASGAQIFYAVFADYVTP